MYFVSSHNKSQHWQIHAKRTHVKQHTDIIRLEWLIAVEEFYVKKNFNKL